MSGTEIWLLVLTAALIVVAMLAAASATALTRLSRTQLDELGRTDQRREELLTPLWESSARHVSSLLLVQTLAAVGAVAVATVVALRVLDGQEWILVCLSILVMTILLFVATGVAAPTLGRQHAPGVARALAGPTKVVTAVLSPVTRLLILLGNAVTPGRGYADGPFSSQAELRELVDQAGDADLIEDDERQMIHSVFQLGDTIVREVMVPRTDMVFIERHKNLRQALNLGLRSGYSRIPVIGESPDDVVGIAYLKDIVRRLLDDGDSQRVVTVDSVMRSATFVPDSKDADDLLREMQANRIHMAIVVDEFGGTDGLVTIEDILEEIVGEIADEYDTEAPEVSELPDGGWRISARMSLEHFADLAEIELDGDVEGVETVSGLLARRLGLVPLPGARIEEQGYELIAQSPEGRRKQVGAIVVRPLLEPMPDADENDHSEPARAGRHDGRQ